MTPSTVLKFLCGNRNAILEIARNQRAIWIGLFFVLSAGLLQSANRYYLFGEFWMFVQPLIQSLWFSFIIYFIVEVIDVACDPCETDLLKKSNLLQRLGIVFTLYWMTTPLNWLHAIPFERIFTSVEQFERNSFFLTELIWIWRGMLVVVILGVLTPLRFLMRVSLVVMIACVSIFYAISGTEIGSSVGDFFSIFGPNLDRYSDSELLICNHIIFIFFMGILIPFIALLVGAFRLLRLGILSICKNASQAPKRFVRFDGAIEKNPTVSPLLQRIAAGLLILSIAILPFTQPQQARRFTAEQLLTEGKIEEGLDYLAAHNRNDFPAHWNPPPKSGYFQKAMERTPHSYNKIEVGPNQIHLFVLFRHKDFPPWIEELFREKARQSLLLNEWHPVCWSHSFHDIPSSSLDKILTIFETDPRGTGILNDQFPTEDIFYRKILQRYSPKTEDQQRIRALLAVAKKGDPAFEKEMRIERQFKLYRQEEKQRMAEEKRRKELGKIEQVREKERERMRKTKREREREK